MKEIQFNQLSKEMLDQLMKGAFLTVKDNNGNLNTMTIAWGSLGYMWRRPIFMVMVRYSRYTHKLIENTNEFTVSFPLSDQLKKELGVCGTKSGREINKFEVCNLTPEKAQKISTPIIGECDLHLECKIVYKHPLNSQFIMSGEIEEIYGAEKDYHVLYYGEILACYVKEND
ncbi:MAG: flavin reductase [Candidatus Melainabacteria bacterium GWF2_32_7]|nr:MAG: flavin reductase [Candidatus Melainabacteria bacterium GWF2_32_7]